MVSCWCPSPFSSPSSSTLCQMAVIFYRATDNYSCQGHARVVSIYDVRGDYPLNVNSRHSRDNFHSRSMLELQVLQEAQTHNTSTLTFGSPPHTPAAHTPGHRVSRQWGLPPPKLCSHQAQRGLISPGSLSWGTSAAIQELLCVSWVFLLPLELGSV